MEHTAPYNYSKFKIGDTIKTNDDPKPEGVKAVVFNRGLAIIDFKQQTVELLRINILGIMTQMSLPLIDFDEIRKVMVPPEPALAAEVNAWWSSLTMVVRQAMVMDSPGVSVRQLYEEAMK